MERHLTRRSSKETLNKSPRTSGRQLFRLRSSRNLEIHKVFLRFRDFLRQKICSPIRTRGFIQRFPDPVGSFCVFLYFFMVLVRVIFSLCHPPTLAFSMIDSERYYYSGLYFAETGQICYPVPIKSAWIMPGISILIGVLARLIPTEAELLWAIRICWILIGSLAPVYLYRSVRLFAPPVYAVLAAACYLLPWYLEQDCYIVTEGPAFAFYTVALYYGLALGKTPTRIRNALLFAVFLGLSVYFRASGILLLPFVLLWQLLCKRSSVRVLLRNAALVISLLVVFFLPWSIRNALVFHECIPFTYTTGDVIYEGSFVGEGSPSEEEMLAYGQSADPAELIARHPSLFDDEGNAIDDSAQQYISHLAMAAYGKLRMRLWFQLRPLEFLKTHLIIKPRYLLNYVWYWDQAFGVSMETAVHLRQINLLLCLLAGLLSLLRKKLRVPVWFLAVSYVVNFYIVSSALPLDRYGQACMPYRIILGALGVCLIVDAVQNTILTRKRRAKS